MSLESNPSASMLRKEGKMIMLEKIKIQQFEGPLDLLLQLIEEQKLDITQVALADVTDQYLAIIHARETWNPEELADFLLIAAKLVLLKSKQLLPMLDFGEEEDDAEHLEAQLKIYKEYLEASRIVQGMIAKKRFLFGRERITTWEPVFSPPKRLVKETFSFVFQEILSALQPLLPVPRTVLEKTISIQERISHIRNIILDAVSVNFHRVISTAKNKTEVIVTFLAVLELVKQRIVDVAQQERFSDFTITKIE